MARVLVQAPQILILDEATANIDSGTEQAIQRALRVIREHTTLVVIAHRLSTIVDADSILVLHRGQAVEQGNHQQLLAQQGATTRCISCSWRASSWRKRYARRANPPDPMGRDRGPYFSQRTTSRQLVQATPLSALFRRGAHQISAHYLTHSRYRYCAAPRRRPRSR